MANTSQSRGARFVLLIIVSFFLIGAGAVGLLGERATPEEAPLAGDWAIDYRGQSHGVITLLPNGRIDSHDDFSGQWTHQHGSVRLKFWAKSETLRDRLNPRNLFHRADEYVLVSSFDPASERYILKNENVTMRPVP